LALSIENSISADTSRPWPKDYLMAGWRTMTTPNRLIIMQAQMARCSGSIQLEKNHQMPQWHLQWTNHLTTLCHLQCQNLHYQPVVLGYQLQCLQRQLCHQRNALLTLALLCHQWRLLPPYHGLQATIQQQGVQCHHHRQQHQDFLLDGKHMTAALMAHIMRDQMELLRGTNPRCLIWRHLSRHLSFRRGMVCLRRHLQQDYLLDGKSTRVLMASLTMKAQMDKFNGKSQQVRAFQQSFHASTRLRGAQDLLTVI